MVLLDYVRKGDRPRRGVSLDYWSHLSRPSVAVWGSNTPLSTRIKLIILYQLRWLFKMRKSIFLSLSRIPQVWRVGLAGLALIGTHIASYRAGHRHQASESSSQEEQPQVVDPVAAAFEAHHAADQPTAWAVARRVLWRSMQVGGASMALLLAWMRFVATPEQIRGVVFPVGNFVGKMIHGYSVANSHLIPKSGPVMIVCYHGFIPSDMYLLPPRIYMETGRIVTVLAADFVFTVPVIGHILRACGGRPASRLAAAKVLSEGGIMLVSPGGVKEAIAGAANDYKLMWGERQGFAEMALQHGAPIIPMFTQNIRHVWVTFLASTKIVQWLYHKTKLPFAFAGPFPVPLTTYFANPVRIPSTELTPKQLAETIGSAIQALMTERQTGSANSQAAPF